MPEFKVGSFVVLKYGKHRTVKKIDGVKRGYIRVGSLLFDWCGNEVNSSSNEKFRIEPLTTG